MKDISKGSAAIAAVLCRVVDYYVAKQAEAVAKENGFEGTSEMEEATALCNVAETRIADAVANIATEVQ